MCRRLQERWSGGVDAGQPGGRRCAQDLGYSQDESEAIQDYIQKKARLKARRDYVREHLSIFDCAFRPSKGSRSIHWRGHIRMMAAVQPFLSGAISKTVNLPAEASVADIESAYLEAWRLGLKAVAIYRDGSKSSQPVSASSAETKAEAPQQEDLSGPPRANRHRLQDERAAVTHHFSIAGHEGYLTVGLYPNGQPGEIFIRMAKEGSTIAGLMECFGTVVSVGLQHGVPLKVLCEKLAHTRFEPSGWTGNEELGYAKSIMDYLFRASTAVPRLATLCFNHQLGCATTHCEALGCVSEPETPRRSSCASSWCVTVAVTNHCGGGGC